MIERDRKLFELEQRLALAGGRLSAGEAARLIADEFLEFGASGRVWRKSDIVPAIAGSPAVERALENFSVTELGPSVCLLIYQSSKRSDGGEGSSRSLRSSIWRCTDGGWQMLFHQGTRCDADTGDPA